MHPDRQTADGRMDRAGGIKPGIPIYRDDREYRNGPRNYRDGPKIAKIVEKRHAPGDISGTTGHTEMVHLSKVAAFYETEHETNFMFEFP